MNSKVFFGLLFTASACASTNNGGHVVGNPLISEGVSAKVAKEPTCDCAKNSKAKGTCKCASDTKTGTSTGTSTGTGTGTGTK